MMGYKIKNLTNLHFLFHFRLSCPKTISTGRLNSVLILRLSAIWYVTCIRTSGVHPLMPLISSSLQLITFFEGIRSEHAMMETVSLNLAPHWFIGYDLDKAVPGWHSNDFEQNQEARYEYARSFSSSLNRLSSYVWKPVWFGVRNYILTAPKWMPMQPFPA